jgi:hypothetical protein
MLSRKELVHVGAILLALSAAGGPVTGTAQTAAADSTGYETPPPGKISTVNRRRLTPLIRRIARKYGVEAALIHALISAESGYDPKAASASGAIGLMQLLPVTARRYGVEHASDLLDPRINLSVGTRHLKVLLKKYRNRRSSRTAQAHRPLVWKSINRAATSPRRPPARESARPPRWDRSPPARRAGAPRSRLPCRRWPD